MLTGSKCSKSPDPATNRGSRFTKYENIVALVTRYLSTTLTPLSSLKRIHGQTQDCCWTSVHKSWNFAPCPENSISAPTHQGSDRHLPKSLDPHGHRSILVGNDGERCNVHQSHMGVRAPRKKKTLPTCAPIPRLESCSFLTFWLSISGVGPLKVATPHQKQAPTSARTPGDD